MADSDAPIQAVQLFDALPVAVVVTTVSGSRVLLANQRCLKLFELAAEERDELAFVDIWASLERRVEIMELLESAGSVRREEVDFVSRGGRRFTASVSIAPTTLQGDRAHVWLLDELDSPPKVSAESDDTSLRQLIAITPTPTLVERESGGAILLANRSAALLFGRLESQLVGTASSALFAAAGQREELLSHLYKGDTIDGVEVKFRSVTDENFTAFLTCRRSNFGGESVILSSISGSPDGVGTESAKHQAAIRDPITGLYNRSYFSRVARHEFERARRYGRTLCVALIDLDSGDGYLGDEMLQALADICLDCVRENDVLARYTGRELVVLLPETALAGAKIVLERMRFEVQHAGFSNDVKGLKCRGGVSEVLTEDDSVIDVVGRAEDALREAETSDGDSVQAR